MYVYCVVVREKGNVDGCADKLVQESVDRGSTDNITAIVIGLSPVSSWERASSVFSQTLLMEQLNEKRLPNKSSTLHRLPARRTRHHRQSQQTHSPPLIQQNLCRDLQGHSACTDGLQNCETQPGFLTHDGSSQIPHFPQFASSPLDPQPCGPIGKRE